MRAAEIVGHKNLVRIAGKITICEKQKFNNFEEIIVTQIGGFAWFGDNQICISHSGGASFGLTQRN